MTVVSVDQYLDQLAIEVVAEFKAPAEKVWNLWADPRKLEKWWGPPGYPATFQVHSLEPGSEVSYYMTGPEGDKFGGWWTIQSVTPPTELTFIDGFANADGNHNDALPATNVRVTFTENSGVTRMVLRSEYASREQLDQVVEMGMLEGIRLATGQMDALLES